MVTYPKQFLEVDQVIGSVIRPTINMLAIFCCAITCFLVIVNPIIAILTGLMLSVIYVIVYLLKYETISSWINIG